jgi:hypothetical protein
MRRYIKKFDPNRLRREAQRSGATRVANALSSEDNFPADRGADGPPPRVQSH